MTRAGDAVNCLVTCPCGTRYMSSATWRQVSPADPTIWPDPKQVCPGCGKGYSVGTRVQAGFGSGDAGHEIPNDIDEYGDFTDTTALYKEQLLVESQCPNCDHKFIDLRQQHFTWVAYCMLGLIGEVGEVAEKLKKNLRGGGDLRQLSGDDGFLKELGDPGWYYAQLSKLFGFRFGQVFARNKQKTEDRKRRGVIHGSGDDR